jgi:DNA repair exonuclease SbcCD nuclease subunit
MRMIITADWHIRNTRPRCRIDEDWIKTQQKALNQIAEICENKNAPLMVVGDIFNSNSDTSFECINMVQKLADYIGGIYILAGNHDLPYHSSENIDKSAIGVLFQSENVFKIEDYSDEFSAPNFDEERNPMPYMFIHTLTIPSKDKPEFIECETPESLLEKYPTAKWIFTGDYHKNFVYEKNGRYVINPGCLIRQVSDMKDYQCGVYFVDTDKEVIEFIPIIDDEKLVNDEYIIRQDEREERIENFVNKLKDVESISLDFIDNVEKALLVNKIDEKLKHCIKELIYD